MVTSFVIRRFVLLACCISLMPLRAAESPSAPDYASVDAILSAHCLDCHASTDPEGKLVLESFETLMKGGEHRSVVGRFFSPELARGAGTGVWIPARLNPRWIRCTACSKMVDSEKAKGTCLCGAALPGPLAYW